ncbi:hypothetical protein KY289_023369 [Solanum tuberosum]|nr:hypothetical protein KY289_023369 [Solanum tuberosum]
MDVLDRFQRPWRATWRDPATARTVLGWKWCGNRWDQICCVWNGEDARGGPGVIGFCCMCAMYVLSVMGWDLVWAVWAWELAGN